MTDEERLKRLSRRGLLWSGAAILGGYGTLRALGTSRGAAIPPALRRVLDASGEIADRLLPSHPVPRFPRLAAREPRFNGDIGISDAIDLDSWRLRVEGLAGESGTRELTLAHIKALPRTEITTELCCIEGWSTVVCWVGARFRDFVAAYPPLESPYVALETPDGNYYVGLDWASAVHPDTLLCYEMNGEPLTLGHGAPLRLAIPIKYGIKNIKRIGKIRFTNARPRDTWAGAGYDWDAGL